MSIDKEIVQREIIRAAMTIIGGIKSPKKAASARANGANGGRPSRGIGDKREIYRAELRKLGDLRAMSPAEREAARALARQRADEILTRKCTSCDNPNC